MGSERWSRISSLKEDVAESVVAGSELEEVKAGITKDRVRTGKVEVVAGGKKTER